MVFLEANMATGFDTDTTREWYFETFKQLATIPVAELGNLLAPPRRPIPPPVVEPVRQTTPPAEPSYSLAALARFVAENMSGTNVYGWTFPQLQEFLNRR
jgi:hypothetical protein